MNDCINTDQLQNQKMEEKGQADPTSEDKIKEVIPSKDSTDEIEEEGKEEESKQQVLFVGAKKSEVLKRVSKNGHELMMAAPNFRADRDVVLAAVHKYGYALRVASEHLQADKEIVIAAIRQHGHALRWASEELQADEEVVLEAVGQNREALTHADEKLLEDRVFMMKAVHANKYVVDFIKTDLRCSKLAADDDFIHQIELFR